MSDFPYDIETYPNFFSIAIIDADRRKIRTYEISFRRDQRKHLIEYLRNIVRSGGRMVGFNNMGFDYPVLHYFLKNQHATVGEIYEYAMRVIDAGFSEEKWKYQVRDKDILIPQVDLFLINHFNNKARMTSLKMLEFVMRSDTIEELPVPVGTNLDNEQADIVLNYNKKDTKETYNFYLECMEAIKFREQLSEEYGKSFINADDTKIGAEIFVHELEKANPGCCFKRGRKQQTIRSEIDLSQCIVPYAEFKRPEFSAVKEWFEKQVIKETKGVFTDILESDLGDVAKYANMRTKRQKQMSKPNEAKLEKLKNKHPMGWLSEEPLKSGNISYYWNWNVVDSLNVVVDGLEYVFGVGGLHASRENEVFRTDDDWVVVDQDVASYYPNLSIMNNVYPEHLGETFCRVYDDIYQRRKVFKKQGNKLQAALKLALNGTYGKSNDKYSPFYDPKFTMTITISGQLSLCMLAEKLLEIPTLKMIQCNTDGLTYHVMREHADAAMQICRDWEKVTKLELEDVTYSAMYISNVNNYIAVSEGGKVKRKGSYAWINRNHDAENPEVSWHQNQSAPIIAKAVCDYMVDGTPVEETITNHEDIYDFMLRTKVPRSSRLVGETYNDKGEIDSTVELQRITRYYVATEGVELIKIMPPLKAELEVKVYVDQEGNEYFAKNKTEEARYKKYEYIGDRTIKGEDRRIGIESGEKVCVCNDIRDYKNNINYNWYINEAKKLVIE